MRWKLFLAVALAVILAACNAPVVVGCPAPVVYSQAFQTRLADELDALKPAAPVPVLMPDGSLFTAIPQTEVDYHAERGVLEACRSEG